jgi:transposase
LALFLEGSELVGRAPLSPAPYTLAPLFQPETASAVTS